MAENRRLSLNFYLVLLACLIGGLLKAALDYGGLIHFKEIISNAYALGTIFGYALAAMIVGFVIAIGINFIFNLFRQIKKPFSYVWVWLFIFIYFIGSMGYTVQQATKVTPAIKENFKQNCINQAKENEKFQDLNTQGQQQVLQKATDFCNKATALFFQLYEQCMNEKGNVKVCIKQSEYQECLQIIKPDSVYCQQLSEHGITQ